MLYTISGHPPKIFQRGGNALPKQHIVKMIDNAIKTGKTFGSKLKKIYRDKLWKFNKKKKLKEYKKSKKLNKVEVAGSPAVANATLSTP